ncbi:hypothetical protein [Mucilaginibacter sp.]|uniref:hypothetical protein n=1 Tax=Mucilaginibacter sp. TaxID=1882438 RepID=UPI00284ECD2D|nr:hypothetical protein [Mucilaginibacter sp.]MDR3695971.1 hypothetical protein [Mucilaginibacter sp.]
MRTIRIHKPVYWAHKSAHTTGKAGVFWDLFFQSNRNELSKATWVHIQLVVQCVLFLPLLVLMATYYHAHFSIVAVICLAFFSNIIACFDRSVRALTSVVAFCVIDAFMLIIFLI